MTDYTFPNKAQFEERQRTAKSKRKAVLRRVKKQRAAMLLKLKQKGAESI